MQICLHTTHFSIHKYTYIFINTCTHIPIYINTITMTVIVSIITITSVLILSSLRYPPRVRRTSQVPPHVQIGQRGSWAWATPQQGSPPPAWGPEQHPENPNKAPPLFSNHPCCFPLLKFSKVSPKAQLWIIHNSKGKKEGIYLKRNSFHLSLSFLNPPLLPFPSHSSI